MARTMDRAARFTIAIALLLAATGCGYSVHSSLDERHQTIHVSSFQNQSKEYDLQAALTNAVIRKFVNDGRLRVVGRDHADLLMEGAILDYSLKGLTYDKNDEVTQFLTIVKAGVRITDRRTGEVVWRDPAMAGETTFSTGTLGPSSDRLRGNAEVFLSTVRSFQTQEENQAASEALEQLASDIFYRTIEPW